MRSFDVVGLIVRCTSFAWTCLDDGVSTIFFDSSLFRQLGNIWQTNLGNNLGKQEGAPRACS